MNTADSASNLSRIAERMTAAATCGRNQELIAKVRQFSAFEGVSGIFNACQRRRTEASSTSRLGEESVIKL